MQKRRLSYVVCFLLSAGLIVLEARYMGIDSDRANHLLQARDIAQGNLFLTGWHLTRAHFLTTDLLAYIIGYLAGGLSYRSVVTAYAVMYVVLMAATLWAVAWGREQRFAASSSDGKSVILSVLSLLYLGVPCWYLMAVGRIHTIAYAYSIAALLLAAGYLRAVPRASEDGAVPDGNTSVRFRQLLVLVCVLTVGSFGDFLVFLYGALPILLYAAVQWYRERERTEASRQAYLALGAAALSSLLFSLLLNLLYYKVGGADPNGSIFALSFSGYRDWIDRLIELFGALLSFAEGNFTGGRVFSIGTFPRLCNALLVLLSLYLLLRALHRFAREETEDVLSILLALSCVIAAAAYIFTERAELRYLEIVPVALSVILLRGLPKLLDERESALPKRRCREVRGVVYLLLLLSVVGRGYELAKGVQINQSAAEERDTVCRIIETAGVKNGYASFWNASVYTVLSGGDVSLRHIQYHAGDPQGMEMYCWFNKGEWYEEPAEFILIDDCAGDRGASDPFGISEQNCVAVFGEPAVRIENEGVIVMIYDYDLSTVLTDAL